MEQAPWKLRLKSQSGCYCSLGSPLQWIWIPHEKAEGCLYNESQAFSKTDVVTRSPQPMLASAESCMSVFGNKTNSYPFQG